ncbi:MAG: N-acetyl-gamma-glutamyl-phosphate reductase [Pseudomonadota bacterium]
MAKQVGIFGASGYTGAELVRLIATHPELEVAALAADRRAGAEMAEVFPHLRHLALPRLQRIEEIDATALDLVFCALPHATTQEVVSALPPSVRVCDLSADFRLRDFAAYKEWYGREHQAQALQAEAVYGLPEFYRDEIRTARIVASTGCNSATGLFAVLPLLSAGVIDPDDIVIDLKTGVTGAGRSPKEGTLHGEVSEGMHAYNVSRHRHMAEFEQEFSKAVGRPVTCRFTPHLIPMNRGILATCYLRGDAAAAHAALATRYADEPFLHVLPFGQVPHTRHIRGSNFVHVGVVEERQQGRITVVAVLDNLVKGASGMGIQNANLMLGLDETAGLMQAPLFP